MLWRWLLEAPRAGGRSRGHGDEGGGEGGKRISSQVARSLMLTSLWTCAPWPSRRTLGDSGRRGLRYQDQIHREGRGRVTSDRRPSDVQVGPAVRPER